MPQPLRPGEPPEQGASPERERRLSTRKQVLLMTEEQKNNQPAPEASQPSESSQGPSM